MPLGIATVSTRQLEAQCLIMGWRSAPIGSGENPPAVVIEELRPLPQLRPVVVSGTYASPRAETCIGQPPHSVFGSYARDRG